MEEKTNSVKYFGYTIEYIDDLDLINKALEVYATLERVGKDNTFLRPRLLSVLSFYMLYGFSADTKRLIVDSLGITMKNLNQINAELNKHECIVRCPRNFRKQHLCEALQALKDYLFSDSVVKAVIIPFVKATPGIDAE